MIEAIGKCFSSCWTRVKNCRCSFRGCKRGHNRGPTRLDQSTHDVATIRVSEAVKAPEVDRSLARTGSHRSIENSPQRDGSPLPPGSVSRNYESFGKEPISMDEEESKERERIQENYGTVLEMLVLANKNPIDG